MYYKIEGGTLLFATISAFFSKMEKSKEAVKKLVKEVGAENFATNRQTYLAGTINAFYFPGGKPDNNWKIMGETYQNLFYPKAAPKENKTLHKKILDLPKVHQDELKKPLNYGNYTYASGGGFAWNTLPAITYSDKVILLHVDDHVEWTPVADVIEITGSEFNEIKEKIEAEHAAAA